MAEREDTYEAPNSKAAGAKTTAGKDAKDVARPKDEVGPYVPDKRGYFAGMALTGICANAALHRSPNAPGFALQMADLMLEEMRKPPPPTEEEAEALRLQEDEERKKLAEKQRKQREADAKVEEDRAKAEEERVKKQVADIEKAEKAERERATALQ